MDKLRRVYGFFVGGLSATWGFIQERYRESEALYETFENAATWLQENTAILANPILDILAVVLIAGIVLVLWARRRRTHARADAQAGEHRAEQS